MRVNTFDLLEALKIDPQEIHRIRANGLINFNGTVEEVVLPQPDIKIMGIKVRFGDVEKPTPHYRKSLLNIPSPW